MAKRDLSKKSQQRSKEGHQCLEKSCIRYQAYLPASKGYSNWCWDHTCTWAQVGPCSRSKSWSDVYCSRHQECKHRGCRRLVEPRADHQLSRYCPRHEISIYQPRASAPLSIDIADTPKDWTWFCRVDGCRNGCSYGDPFCANHLCSVSGCHRATYLNDPSKNRCLEHLPCPAAGCTLYRAVGDNKPAKYCRDHHLCGDHLGDDPDHECKAVILRGQKFCQGHRCLVDSCTESRFTWLDGNNKLCKGHTCSVSACTSPTSNTLKNREHRYCDAHTCQFKGCYLEAEGSSGVPVCPHHRRSLGTPSTYTSTDTTAAEQQTRQGWWPNGYSGVGGTPMPRDWGANGPGYPYSFPGPYVPGPLKL